jgi:hypothetical protein
MWTSPSETHRSFPNVRDNWAARVAMRLELHDDERRTAPRVRLRLAVRVTSMGHALVLAVTNLSKQGLGVVGVRGLYPGQLVTVSSPLAENTNCKARVVWVCESHAGLSLLDTADEDAPPESSPRILHRMVCCSPDDLAHT